MNKYFKLYTRKDFLLWESIDIFYGDKPVNTKAIFDGDRYTFSLPPELDEKMITGDLEADFLFDNNKGRSTVPVSLVLTDRYW
jgi:hypothetical protein